MTSLMGSAAILIIGNEVLSGKVRDANGPYLLREFRSLGQPVGRVVTVPDHVGTIADTVRELSASFDHVVSCGGVGPTFDDVTIDGLAAAFRLSITSDPLLEDTIRRHFGPSITPAHLRMARVPAGAEMLWPEGAPWPVMLVRNVLVLPGSPELVERKWPAVRERYRAAPFHLHRVFLTVDEGLIADTLDTVDQAWPDVGLGSYPVFDPADHHVMVTVEGKDPERVAGALNDLLHRLGPSVVLRVE